MVFGAVFNMNGEGILLNFLIISSQKERPCWVWSLGVLDLSCPHFDLKTLLFLGTANFVGRFSVTVPKPLIRPEEFASTKILGSHKKWLPLSAMSSFVRSGHPVIPYWESVCLMDWWPNHHDMWLFMASFDGMTIKFGYLYVVYHIYIWLVVEVYLPLWKTMEFVRLDHHPNYWGK